MKLPGSIVERSPGRWAIILEQRDPVTRKRKQKLHSFKGTRKEAMAERVRLLHETNDGTYIEPSKLTVEQWIDQWIEAGAPGRKKKKVGQRTLERYEELLRVHVKPKLGARPFEKIRSRSREPNARAEINEIQFLNQFDMAFRLKIKLPRRSPFIKHDIIRRILPHRHIAIGWLRNLKQKRLNRRRRLLRPLLGVLHLRLQFRHPRYRRLLLGGVLDLADLFRGFILL